MTRFGHVCLVVVVWQCCFVDPWQVQAWSLAGRQRPSHNIKKIDAQYDLVIVGAGASGLFASGAALSFGMKTLLLDQSSSVSNSSNEAFSTPKYFVGGDCTNAACVPSKALRSISRMATNGRLHEKLAVARDHTFGAVAAVRNREDVSHFDNVTNLYLAFSEYGSCQFVSNNELEYNDAQISTTIAGPTQNRKRIRAKKFLIATGASPIVPTELQRDAKKAGLPLYTYRDILSPDSENSAWGQFCESNKSTSSASVKRIVVAGGGPTAVELAQSLVRLQLNVTIVAPTLLGAEDVSLQQAACKILHQDGVELVLGKRVTGVDVSNRDIVLAESNDGGDDDSTIISRLQADAMIVCMGRRPTVASLNLTVAGVAWNETCGVHVNPASLQSHTNPRVFACGDCCSAVVGKDRKAAHAAWTGYHAVRNLALPRILWAGSPSVHPTVPSVTYADPELASVGLSRSKCIETYGQDGFIYQSIREEGSDRADMERLERNVNVPFVELRAERHSGKILGLTACGPAAAELANEIGLAIQTKLTVRDLARSIHSYPSHGYVLYRLALSMALSSTRGFLDTLGPLCQILGKVSGAVGLARKLHPKYVLPWMRLKRCKQRKWEASGQRGIIISASAEETIEMPVSFLDCYKNERERTAGQERASHSKAYEIWRGSR